MKILLTFLISLLVFTSYSQTSLTWTVIGTGSDDLNRPNGGANEWTEGQNVVNIPNACCATPRLSKYYRFLWRDFYPGSTPSNSINFTVFDREIQSAIAANKTFSFGVMQQCGGCDANRQENVGGFVMSYPIWLHNQMQAESPTDYVANGQWYPNYNSPSYIAGWSSLHQQINNHIQTTAFNGVAYKNIIFQVETRGYGDYGEWAINDFTITATVASLDSIIAKVKDAYPDYWVCTMMASFDGNQLGVTQVPPAVGYYALTTSNRHGPLGWRRDNWGSTEGYVHLWTDNNTTVVSGLHFDTAIMNRWKYAPILGEPANENGSVTDIANEIPFYHVNSFGNGNIYGLSTDPATQTAFRTASKLAGYRIALLSSGSSMTTSPQTGGSYNVTINWSNVNGIPAYDDWRVVYEWRDGAVVLQRDTTSFRLKLFYASTFSDNENFTLRTVPAGTHDLYLKVVDPRGYMIPMPLFITGRLADGSYPIRTGITVTAGTGVGVANAGPSQTISLPTSSVTVDGSASSGTITSYAWSQLSGPNSSAIATPTSVNSTVSGLIAGTYLIQLQVNGVSTDTMRIYVNPATPPSNSATTIFTTQTTSSGTVTDGVALEVGLKFQSTVAGYITGIRFYKSAGNTGTHIGQLYKGDGTLLASVTFVGETTSGWQVAQVTPAVPILANTTYITAYFSPNGFYSYTSNFLGANIVNSPLLALADGVDGRNGVYDYSATPTFPTSYSTNGNRPWYGNDVVFSLTNPGTVPLRINKNIYFKDHP